MTSRYALYDTGKLFDRFALAKGLPRGVKPHYNISPGQFVPVVVNREGTRNVEVMKWGFIPAGAKDGNAIFRYKTFVARSEGIFHKPTWQTVIRTQRCLIPANGFYEWRQSTEGKNPFYIHPSDQALFGFAGIYSSWTDPEGQEWGMCAIVTADSGTQHDTIPERLPIIVYPADEADWLNPDITDVSSLYNVMRPYHPDRLAIAQVGEAVNSTKVNGARLIEPFIK